MGWQSMASVGHFLTMVGVFAFYSTILEAHIEKKVGIYFHTIVARFSKRTLYYIYKIVYYQSIQKQLKVIPSWYARKLMV